MTTLYNANENNPIPHKRNNIIPKFPHTAMLFFLAERLITPGQKDKYFQQQIKRITAQITNPNMTIILLIAKQLPKSTCFFKISKSPMGRILPQKLISIWKLIV